MISRRNILSSLVGVAVISSNTRAVFSMPNSKPNITRLPEEGDPHLRTFMQWPVNAKVHPDRVFLSMLQQSVADIANEIVQFEPVVMLMAEKHQKSARRKLSAQVEIWDIPTDDLWCRDSGPVFVHDENSNLAIRQLNFNGWGNKQVHTNDGNIATRIAQRLSLPIIDNGLVGELGGVESDGAGTLLAHESSWVNKNRNHQGQDEVAAKLLESLGGDKMIWAPGIKGADITDYHIDSLARFIGPGSILIQMPEQRDAYDPWSIAAFETYEILNNATDANGNSIELTIIPEPANPRVTADDFVASYANYYLCNGAVISAQFGDEKADQQANELLASIYPNREIIALNIDPIGEIGGGIHCATQQQPVN